MVDELQAGIGQFTAKLTGASAIYIAVLMAALISTGYLLYHSTEDAHHEHLAIQEGLDELVYVQTLSESDRRALSLTMPDSLRKKRNLK